MGVSIGRAGGGVLLATVLLYAWGMIYWGFSSFPYSVWNETRDDRAAGEALLEHFPESGVYYLPANGNPPELRSELYESGPTGFVFIDRDGRPEMDSSIMIQGFFVNLAFAAAIAALMVVSLGASSTYASRFGISAVAGVAAVLLIHFGDAVWWALPWNWELMQVLYNFSAWLLASAVLARFVRAES